MLDNVRNLRNCGCSRGLLGGVALASVAAMAAWTAPLPVQEMAPPDFEARPAPAEDPSATWRLTNRPQAIEARFGTGGMSVGPHGGGAPGWTWGLALVGAGPAGSAAPVAPVEPMALGNRVEYRRPGLIEWYVNDHRGVEQGFTILEPPAGSPTQFELLLAMSGSLSPSIDADAAGLALRDAGGATVLAYGGLHAFDARGRALSTRMDILTAAAGPLLRISVDIGDAEFPVVVDPLISTLLKKLIGLDGGRFGFSVSISGDTAVVGAWFANKAYVFERNVGGVDNWGQVKTLTAAGQFGFSVALDGDTVVVGAKDDLSPTFVAAGSASVFERNAGGVGNWGQVKKLMAADGAGGDHFGLSVTIAGHTVVVGARDDDDAGKTDSGAAYVFERNAGGVNNWGQVKKLTAADAVGFNHRFGAAVSLSGDTVVVGADQSGVGNGSAYLFERDAGGVDNWGPVKQLTAGDGSIQDFFGTAVSLSGDTVAVGAFGDDASPADTDHGAVYVFDRNAGGPGGWGQVVKLTHAPHTCRDLLGTSVSTDGNLVIAGAPGADLAANCAGESSGAAYVFDRGRGWSQVLTLSAADGTTLDQFGISVSVSGGTVVAGADGDGSAYVFGLSVSAVCGDGLQEASEECDDGTGNSDVLPDACRTDCTLAGCGDAVVDTGEVCDDGNTVGGDDCAADCSVAAVGVPGEAATGGDMRASPAGSGIEVLFSPACAATDHAAYWGQGPIQGAVAWVDSACGLGTSGSASFDPGSLLPGQWLYFVVVGYDGDHEGSYGRDSALAQRPEAVGVGACDRPGDLSTCE